MTDVDSRIVEVSHADSVVRARGLVARHHGHDLGSITSRHVCAPDSRRRGMARGEGGA